jgi:hypothetical protein
MIRYLRGLAISFIGMIRASSRRFRLKELAAKLLYLRITDILLGIRADFGPPPDEKDE